MLHRAIEAIGALVLLQAIQVPQPPRGYGTEAAEIVVDQAGVLSAEQEARINRIAFDVHRKSGGEIAVVTIPDIGQRASSEVALEIGRQWGVGDDAQVGNARRNAGVVILLVPKETNSSGQGQCRIEVGQGGEGFIIDAEGGSICRSMTPLFQQRAYGEALVAITSRVAEEFAREFGFALDTSLVVQGPAGRIPESYGRQIRGRGVNPATLVMIFLVLMFVFSAMGGGGRRRRGGCGGCMPIFLPFPMGGGGYHRGGWGGGGGGFGGGFGGGGFGGFGGGGGFSGGGGGSSW